MDIKARLDKFKADDLVIPEIEREGDYDAYTDDFKILNYKLIVRHHFKDLWDLHNKKISQWYQDIHTQFVDYRFRNSKEYVKNFCPIYLITLNSPPDPSAEPPETKVEVEHEILFYVGQTNQKKNRFHDGHRATQKLLNPDYHQFDKNIYFAQVLVNFHYLGYDYEDIPLEWLKPLGIVDAILTFLEYFFIFQESTELGNDDGLKNRKRNIAYRKWEDLWPSPDNDESGISIEIDSSSGIHSPLLYEIGQTIWSLSLADMYKEQVFAELESDMNEDDDEEE
ncbi:hypothetical protein [Paenibacillus qinlingensis]|uniref:hypothetical protein n=1 Tax=Paenibacillus qinlingensis TaxID=1837343 RepID=UPI0015638505|nr:hypothetical protein [Paenibacillus qinlingensis]NQX63268.1 hypothetical protein [Paenibacillus qinlingensis]